MGLHFLRGRTGWTIALGLVLVGVVAGAVSARWYHLQRPVREATASYDARDYWQALRWANWQLRRKPADMRALKIQARALARLGQADRAIQVFLQIPDLSAEDYFLLGSSYTRLKRFEMAVDPLQQSLQLGPMPEYRRTLAVVYGQLGRIDEAIEQAQLVANDRDPLEADLGLALLGELLHVRGLARESLEAFDALLARNPDLRGVPQNKFAILLHQVEALLALGETERAGKIIDQLGDLNHNVRGLRLRGQFHEQKGNRTEAEQDWVRALELEPTDVVTIVDLALLLTERDAMDEAIRWLHQAEQIRPEDPSIQQHLAVAYTKVGNQAAATVHQRQAARLRDRLEQEQGPVTQP